MKIPPFNDIGSVASVAALAIMLVGFAWRSFRSLRRRFQEAEDTFDQELSRLEASGNTVSARTDLGFLVSFRLGALRDVSSDARHGRTFLIILIFLLMYVSSELEPRRDLAALAALSIVIMVGLFGMTASEIVLRRTERRIDRFKVRISAIWERPIEKRIPANNETK